MIIQNGTYYGRKWGKEGERTHILLEQLVRWEMQRVRLERNDNGDNGKP